LNKFVGRIGNPSRENRTDYQSVLRQIAQVILARMLSLWMSIPRSDRGKDMESQTMGRVTVLATVENLNDVGNVRQGLLPSDQVRRVEIPDALIDTGATILSMPRRFIEQLGLTPLRTRTVRTSAGLRVARIYGTVRLTIQGRDCPSDVAEVPDDCPTLVGQVPLELMDFVVDPANQRLIGNPAHGGEEILEMY
jgi:predicted aspartyl protease